MGPIVSVFTDFQWLQWFMCIPCPLAAGFVIVAIWFMLRRSAQIEENLDAYWRGKGIDYGSGEKLDE